MNEEKWNPGPEFNRAVEWFLKCPETFVKPGNKRLQTVFLV